MFDQTPINRLNGLKWDQDLAHTNVGSDTGAIRRLMADATELVELQARLVADDVKCLARSVLMPLIWGSIGLVIVLGTIPVFLLAGANGLVAQFGWSLALAQLAAAGAGLLIALIFGAVAIRKAKACGPPLHRSFDEMEKNLATLREMLAGRETTGQHLEGPGPRGY